MARPAAEREARLGLEREAAAQRLAEGGRERARSVTLARPSSVTSAFSGLKSR